MNEVIRLCMLIFFSLSYHPILFHRRGGFVNAARIDSFQVSPVALTSESSENPQRNVGRGSHKRSEQTICICSTEELNNSVTRLVWAGTETFVSPRLA